MWLKVVAISLAHFWSNGWPGDATLYLGVNAAVEALIKKTQIFNLEAHPEKMSLTVFYVFCYVFNKKILKCPIV